MAQHTIDLPCIADTYIDSGNPNTNYGSATLLNAGGEQGSSSPFRYYALFKFDWTSLPTRKKVINAKVRLYSAKAMPSVAGCRIGGSVSQRDFNESTVTYNNYGSTPTSHHIYYSGASLAANTWYEFDFTSDYSIQHEKLINYGVSFIWTKNHWNDNPNFWQIQSREGANPPVLRVTYEDAPPNEPTLTTPVSVYKDSASIIRFEWQYNSSVGGAQKKFDLQWSTNQSDWTTVSETTENTYYDMPADSFPAGNIYWRVQTYNEYDESSGYSDAAVFYSVGAPIAPLIQSVSDECRPLVEWMSFDQQIYQIQILQDETVIYDTSDIPGISTRQHRIPIFLDDGEYLARIRIKNEYDMLSEWGTTSFTISTTKPDKPTLSIQRSRYGLELTIGGEQETSYIYRDGVCIAITEDEKYFDNTVANEKEYQYFVRALSEDGFNDSNIELGTPSFRYGLLNTGDEVIELKHNINTVPGKNLNNTQSGTLNMYDGRKYPVPEMSSNVEQTLVLGYFFKTYPEVEKIIEIADRKEIVLYRDKRGRKMYGKITGLAVQDTFHGHDVSITISATDYNEAVEI